MTLNFRKFLLYGVEITVNGTNFRSKVPSHSYPTDKSDNIDAGALIVCGFRLS